MYTASKANLMLTGHVIANEKPVGSSFQCMQYCANMANRKCKSFNYKKNSRSCHLNSETGRQEIDDMETREGFSHYEFSKDDMIMLP